MKRSNGRRSSPLRRLYWYHENARSTGSRRIAIRRQSGSVAWMRSRGLRVRQIVRRDLSYRKVASTGALSWEIAGVPSVAALEIAIEIVQLLALERNVDLGMRGEEPMQQGRTGSLRADD